MANYISFSDESILANVHGRFSVITVEHGPFTFVPQAINIDLYVDGVKQKGKDQVFQTSDINDNILRADLEDKVYISTDAIGLYEGMKECGQIYQDANGNLEIYSEMLAEKMRQDDLFSQEENEDLFYNDGYIQPYDEYNKD